MEAVVRCRKGLASSCYKAGLLAWAVLALIFPLRAQELPAGTRLEARLCTATGSRLSHRGDPVEATIIAPVGANGHILVPQGATLLGSVTEAEAIGLGLRHFTASLTYEFSTLRFPDGATAAIKTQLVEVETAKEHVDQLGTVHGIHPFVNLSSSLSFYTFPFLVIDPAVGVPVLAVKSLIAPSANPEIYFPVGTEIILRTTSTVKVPPVRGDFASVQRLSASAQSEFGQLLKRSAQRAFIGNRPSDIVNLMLIGNRAPIDRAFRASGWSWAQRKSPISLYRMYSALSRRHGYAKAPMNGLRLNGATSAFVRQKSLDTVEKRHHVRFWQYPGRTDVWLGTAAKDAGFRFNLTHWTHFTDPQIDHERAKVVDDLAFTGCVTAAGLLPRTPGELKRDPNAKHPVVTDGKVAVVQLNACDDPHLMAGAGDTSVMHQHGRLARAVNAFRDDLVRSNVFFTTYNTFRWLERHKTEAAAGSTSPTKGDSREPGAANLPGLLETRAE